MPIINKFSVENNCVKFQIDNTKGIYKISFTNALRRILISHIKCYIIDFKDVTFIENNSLFNNEFLKSRLCLIPILSNNQKVNYEFLQVTCNKKNDSNTIEDVLVSDFKIKDRTTEATRNPITNLGNRYQISIEDGFWPPLESLSTFKAQ